MKKFIIASLGIGLFCMLMNSCRKNDISGDSKNLVEGAYITLDSTIASNLNISDNASAVSIKIKNSVGSPVASINIYAATGSSSLDTSTWVLIKNVPYSDGVVLSVTTADLAKAFGSTPLSAGNNYTLQNQVVTKDGRKFSVANTPSTYNSFPAYNMALTWHATAVCAFVQADAIGSYKVVTDSWSDFSVGDPINVTAGPDATSIQFLAYPSPAYGGIQRVAWVVEVDPATGNATIAKQQVGYYNGAATADNLTTVSGSGIVFSCTGFITLKVTVNVGGTDYTGQTFEIQKQ